MIKYNKGILAASTALLTVLAVGAAHAQDGRSDGRNIFDDLSNPAYDSNASVGTIPGDNLGNHMAEGTLDMRGHPIANLDMPAFVDSDFYAVNVEYLRSYVATYGGDNLGNHIATQALIMGNFPIKITAQPGDPNDAVNKAYVDTQIAALPGPDNLGNHTATQILDMGNNRIVGLRNPSADRDAVNLEYLTDYVAANGDDLGSHIATQELDMATFAILNLPVPTADHHAATKLYVDGLISGNNDDIDSLRNRQINAGQGLTGGGRLTSDVTLSFNTGWGDGRYALASRTVTGTDGVSGGGSLSGNQVLRVDSTVVRTSGAQTIAGPKTFTGNMVVSGADGIAMSGRKITGLATPTHVSDAATKAYVDSRAGGSYSAGGGLWLSDNVFSLQSNQYRRNSWSTDLGVVAFNGNTKSPAEFYSGSQNPNNTARLNYDGVLYATNFYATAYYYFSDRNLKKDIETIDHDGGMAIVRDLRPVSYTWKQNDHKALGVIAQEVELVVPTAVTVTEGGERAVDYIQLIAPMLAAIQELDGRVKALEAAAR